MKVIFYFCFLLVKMILQTIDDFLEPDDLLNYQKYVIDSGLSQTIKHDDTFVAEFWKSYGEKLNQHLTGLHFTGLYPQVTVSHSGKPIARHTDGKYNNEKYKMLIYLNDVPDGGTVFFGETTTIVKNQMNRVAVFDIRLPHEGQKFVMNGTKKMTLGFRLKE
jgi:hypothetical protein